MHATMGLTGITRGLSESFIIARHELRRLLRSATYRWMALASLGLPVGMILLVSFTGGIARQDARPLLLGLAIGQQALLLSLVAVWTARTVHRDAAEGHLEHLLLTRCSVRDILLGKYLAALGGGLGLVAVALPWYLGLALRAGDLLTLGLVLLTWGVGIGLAAAFGLDAIVATEGSSSAVVQALVKRLGQRLAPWLPLLGMVFVPFSILLGLLSSLSTSGGWHDFCAFMGILLFALVALPTPFTPLGALFYTWIPLIGLVLIFYALASLGVNLWLARRLLRHTLERAGTLDSLIHFAPHSSLVQQMTGLEAQLHRAVKRQRELDRWEQEGRSRPPRLRRMGEAEARQRERWRRLQAHSWSPVYLRDVGTHPPSTWLTLTWCAALGIAVGGVLPMCGAQKAFPGGVRFVVQASLLYLILQPMLLAAAYGAREREWRTWSDILLTRLTNEDILLGKIFAALRPVLWVGVVLWGVNLLMAAAGGLSGLDILCLTLAFVIYPFAYTALALYLSLQVRTVFTATLSALGLLFLPLLGRGLLGPLFGLEVVRALGIFSPFVATATGLQYGPGVDHLSLSVGDPGVWLLSLLVHTVLGWGVYLLALSGLRRWVGES
ncbi:MAG TPA: hypothetical protein EYP85_10535 [Armatimonadetes bacterium]|nr:hypothetical protein [Armatimonadota bacterium]